MHALIEKAQEEVMLLKGKSEDHGEKLTQLPQLEQQLSTFQNKMDEIVDKVE